MNQVGYAPPGASTFNGAPFGQTMGGPGFSTMGPPRPVGPVGVAGPGYLPQGAITTTRPVTDTYGLGGDPERRLNEASARQLARMVFLKYDDNDSGFMNSVEAANLITDLYASVNMEYRATPEEGKEFMKANDSDYNWQFNRDDFEEFFVKHLSTQNNFSGFNLFGDMTRALPTTYKQPIHAPGAHGHFHREDPLNVVAGTNTTGISRPPVFQSGAPGFGAPIGQGFGGPAGPMYSPQPLPR